MDINKMIQTSEPMDVAIPETALASEPSPDVDVTTTSAFAPVIYNADRRDSAGSETTAASVDGERSEEYSNQECFLVSNGLCALSSTVHVVDSQSPHLVPFSRIVISISSLLHARSFFYHHPTSNDPDCARKFLSRTLPPERLFRRRGHRKTIFSADAVATPAAVAVEQTPPTVIVSPSTATTKEK